MQFEANLRALGIKPITSRAYHPTTCGKNERHHQTCRRWLSRRPTASTIEELQSQLDEYRVAYNTQRPHQGIAMSTPAARHHSGQRLLPHGTAEPEQHATPTTCTEHIVNARGQLRLAATAIGLGSQWAGCKITAFRNGDHVLIFHRDDLVRELIIDPTRTFQPTGEPRGGHRRTRHLDTIN